VIDTRSADGASFRTAWTIQRQVLWALLMREVITRFGRRNLGVLWLMAEPMMFTLGVAALWSAAGMGHGSALPIIAFAITGYSSVLMWRNAVGRCTNALQSNLNLLYHRRVHALDVFLTRVLLELIGATMSFLLLTIFFVALEVIRPPEDYGLLILGWLMLGWFALGLALTIGGLSAWSHLVERFWHPISYVMFPLSGAAFMVEWLPPAAREVVLLLPMVHGVELMREGFFGAAVTTYYDFNYLALSCLLLTGAGVWLARHASRVVEAE
jgi:capsular polysaccharide transport system permease protein